MSGVSDDRSWDVPGQEHMDTALYARYHRDVWMPSHILDAAKRFLPLKGTDLPLSKHYTETRERRNLPVLLYMPLRYDIIDVTVVREADAIFRVLIRAPFNRRIDIGIVLEGDYEVVTAFWLNPKDDHETLDVSVYKEHPDVAAARADPEFMAGVREGIQAMKEGRFRPWTKIKDELGIVSCCNSDVLAADASDWGDSCCKKEDGDEEARRQSEGAEEARKQSRPDDQT